MHVFPTSHFLEQRADVSKFVVRIASRPSYFESLRVVDSRSNSDEWTGTLSNSAVPHEVKASRAKTALHSQSSGPWVYSSVGSPEIIHRKHSQAFAGSEVKLMER